MLSWGLGDSARVFVRWVGLAPEMQVEEHRLQGGSGAAERHPEASPGDLDVLWVLWSHHSGSGQLIRPLPLSETPSRWNGGTCPGEILAGGTAVYILVLNE